MGVEIVTAIIGFFKLLSLILGEIFEAKKRARLANEKYEIDKQKFIEISQKCIDKMRSDAALEAHQAQDVEDQIDKRL